MEMFELVNKSFNSRYCYLEDILEIKCKNLKKKYIVFFSSQFRRLFFSILAVALFKKTVALFKKAVALFKKAVALFKSVSLKGVAFNSNFRPPKKRIPIDQFGSN